jgi:DNA primase
MGRIPEAELERLKREVSLLEWVQAAGVELRRHGANWLGRCPFHDDRTPSLVVTPAKNLWHCLGACRAGGSVIDWVMRMERVSFRHAVERLRQERPGLEAAPTLALDPAADDATLLRQVVDFYHQTLLQSPEAIGYLARRGLDHREAIEHFRLGVANRTLGYALPPKLLKAGALIRGRLQGLGIVRASGHEHFTGSLVVPVLSPAGVVTGLYGRKLRDDLRAGTPKHLYLPGPHRGVWNEAALAESKEIILCEALLDALTFWVAGYRNVTASYGVRGFTAEHLAAFQRAGTERVLIAYDRDAAGETAAAAVAQELERAGLACYRIQFPRGMDANAYALKLQPAAQSLGLLIRQAVWLGAGAPPPQPPRAFQGETDGAPSAPPAVSFAAAPPTPDTAPPANARPEPLSLPAPLPSPEPPPALPEVPLTISEHDVMLTLGERVYRARGLGKNLSPETLRVTLVARRGPALFADTLDLYAAGPRQRFAVQAARELGLEDEVVKQDLGTLLLKLETLRDQQLAARAAAPPPAGTAPTPTPPPITALEREAALALLGDPRLLERIQGDFAWAGVVGEATNVLVGYLATVSRLLPQPLAIIVQSASAAGKTSLMDAILAFVPPEHRVHYSAMTSQALYYLGEQDLRHKVLSVVEEEGAERASYALKLLQSEGELTIASTGKDPQTGKLVTHEYRVEGPVQLFLTTTAVSVDEELANRALVLTVDESAAQTRAIHQRQRAARTLEGLLARAERAELTRLHQHAQRLLEPLAVVNPYAPELAFLDGRTRTRRDHEKYLTLIDAIALLHQHQREHHMVTRHGRTLTYVEVTPEDIAVANRLAAEVLARSLDELPPQTRRFLTVLDHWVAGQCAAHRLARSSFRFTAREAREAVGLGATQVKLHLHRLVELEYVLLHRAPRGQGVAYELALESDGEGYDPVWSVAQVLRPGVGQPSIGGEPGVGRTRDHARIPLADERFASTGSEASGQHTNGRPAQAGSHVPMGEPG